MVVTNRQGQQRTVAETGYSYDRKAKQLRFNAGVLTAQDESLAVNVARECHIIISRSRARPAGGGGQPTSCKIGDACVS